MPFLIQAKCVLKNKTKIVNFIQNDPKIIMVQAIFLWTRHLIKVEDRFITWYRNNSFKFPNFPFFSKKHDKILIFWQNGPKWNISPPKIWESWHYIGRIGRGIKWHKSNVISNLKTARKASKRINFHFFPENGLDLPFLGKITHMQQEKKNCFSVIEPVISIVVFRIKNTLKLKPKSFKFI